MNRLTDIIAKISANSAHILALGTTYLVFGCSATLNNPPAATTQNTSITGTSPIVADGISTSTISIVLVDNNGIALVGATPTFTATDTNSTNSYGTCSATNSAGASTCTLKSSYAETKVLSITSPVNFMGGSIVFTPAPESQITIGTEPYANAVAGVPFTAQPSFQIRDPLGNLVATPSVPVTLTAFTDSNCTTPGTGQVLATNNPQSSSGGIATFSGAAYTKAGVVYLQASAPGLKSVCTSGITVVHNVANKLSFATEPAPTATAGVAYPTQPVVDVLDYWDNLVLDGSTAAQNITLSAWGNSSCTSTVTGVFSATATTVASAAGVAPFAGVNHTRATAIYLQAAASGLASTCSTATNVVPNVADAGQSTITGTSPVAANGYHYSTITITDYDQYDNPRVGDTNIQFSATDSGSNNVYGACSATNSSGQSTCTLKSSTVELKTLYITHPVSKAGGTVNFITPPLNGNSSIVGSGPVVANGAATSTITVTLIDASGTPVVGITPTFTATDTGSTNGYGGCSATNSSGVATCTLTSTKAETKTLSLTEPMMLTGGTVVFTNGPASQARFTATPNSGTAAGVNFSPQPLVQLYDQFMNPVTVGATASMQVTLAAYSDPTCQTFGTGSLTVASNPQAASTGVVTYSGVNYTKAGTFYLGVYGSGLTTACSSAISVVHNTADHLSFSQQPSSATTAGTAFSPQPVVQVLDHYGNIVTSGTDSNASITIAAMNSSCTAAASPGALIGTAGVTASAGVASYSNLSYTGATTIALQASGGGLPSICSNSITVSPGAAVNSTITGTSPVVADGTSASTVTITLLDAYANPYVGYVPLFSATDGGGTNHYNACSSSSASGVSTCTFTSRRAENKTLQLTYPASIAGGTVVFTYGAAYMVAYAAQPSSSALAGATFAQSPVAQIQDQYGNAVMNSTAPITLNAYSNSGCSTAGTGTLHVTTNPLNANGTNGAASFSGLSYTKSGSLYLLASSGTLQGVCSSAVIIGAAAANASNSSISATTPVTADGSSTSTISIVLKDSYGNPLTGVTPNVTVSGSGNSSVTCSVVNSAGASTCTFTSTKAETKSVTMTSPLSLAANSVTFSPGTAAQLVFTAEPSNAATAGVALAQSPSVQVQDAHGNPLNSSTLSITLSATTNSSCSASGSGTLGGTTTANANGTNGTAAFSGVSYTGAGSLYIQATSGLLTGCSSLVTVSPAAAAKLAFSVQPSSQSLIRATWATAPTVQVLDTYGNLVTSASNSVTLSPYDDSACSTTPGAGSLSASSIPLSASGGVAAFSNMSYSAEELIYLKASSGSLAPACSSAANIIRWSPISSSGAPSARTNHTAIWTGSQMIVWGGVNSGTYYNTGAIYTPSSDSWRSLGPRKSHRRLERLGNDRLRRRQRQRLPQRRRPLQPVDEHLDRASEHERSGSTHPTHRRLDRLGDDCLRRIQRNELSERRRSLHALHEQLVRHERDRRPRGTQRRYCRLDGSRHAGLRRL